MLLDDGGNLRLLALCSANEYHRTGFTRGNTRPAAQTEVAVDYSRLFDLYCAHGAALLAGPARIALLLVGLSDER